MKLEVHRLHEVVKKDCGFEPGCPQELICSSRQEYVLLPQTRKQWPQTQQQFCAGEHKLARWKHFLEI